MALGGGLQLSGITASGRQTINVADDSARTFIHDMKKTTGLKHDDINKDLIVKEIQHKNFLDALLFSDNTKKKYSLTPVITKDITKNSTRDMLVFSRENCLKMEMLITDMIF
ncbi:MULTISPECIES: 2OG-Fe dioxygenase family protein [Yersinia]|uniref:2OG-Fe dioxygenase family protein n=1 Tax=Yersinia TaxID=629 RepID=UPI0013CDEA60|nr:2OG-Fe dioxygenase family protein [Yersinia sp. IP36721]